MYLHAKNQALVNCINSRDFYKSTPFFSIRTEGYNTTQGTGAHLQQGSLAADASITRLLNTLSSCCLLADLCDV
jgi:hypothetical protein